MEDERSSVVRCAEVWRLDEKLFDKVERLFDFRSPFPVNILSRESVERLSDFSELGNESMIVSCETDE